MMGNHGFLLLLCISLLLPSALKGGAEEDFRESLNFYSTGKEVRDHIQSTLKNLLTSYNRRIRPNFGGPPCKIIINLGINSMGPVSEKTESFLVDAYFRQSWVDPRLSFNATSSVSELSLNWKILNKIWKPDTFFLNGKKSKMHKITVPNRFVRIAPDGLVSFSQRLTIHATCQMMLKKFPFDSQECPIFIGSYGYTAEEIIYNWKETALELSSFAKSSMTQFHLIKWVASADISLTNRFIAAGFRNDSIAAVNFSFQRQYGFFLLQIYTPMLIIVMCSWVAFWIVKTDAPSRVSLGVASSLSVTKIGFAGKGKPNVEYATALDIFIMICFMTVFLSLVEYALINYISVFINRYKAVEEEQRILALKKAQKNFGRLLSSRRRRRIHREKKEEPRKKSLPIDVEEDMEESTLPGKRCVSTMTELPEKDTKKPSKLSSFDYQRILRRCSGLVFKVLETLERRATYMLSLLSLRPVPQMYIYTNTEEALEAIDSTARKAFPLTFIFIMLFYILLYFYIL